VHPRDQRGTIVICAQLAGGGGALPALIALISSSAMNA
jgi:hypothetical protein